MAKRLILRPYPPDLIFRFPIRGKGPPGKEKPPSRPAVKKRNLPYTERRHCLKCKQDAAGACNK
ncbi:Uncharacterized protein ChrSV_2061 [Chromobacterium vaccinii]|nr:Uncharacterized protein ChrSW_2061 [Chromobacterium vaccinii]QND89519.1 Uncharacterized protein ChrSV_2061 [Chromobacterium vaccinii]